MPEDIYNIPRTFGSPNRFALGANAVEKFNLFVPLLGKRGFLFGGSTSLSTCEDSIRDSLGEAGAEVVEYSSGERYCTDKAADRLTEMGNAAEADCIIGVGGGSVMDLAKFVAHKMGVNIALVNTIASTDAPCSALSVIYDENHVFQRYEFFHKSPELVVVDTRIIAEGPVRFLRAGMGDASATKWEAEAVWSSTSKNCLVDGGLPPYLALNTARLCHDLLMRYGKEALDSCEENIVSPQLEAIVEANTLLSGVGFESGGLAAAHAVHDGLTAAPNVDAQHGGLVSFGTLTQLVMENKPREDIQNMLSFYNEVGLPTTLDEINVSIDDLDTVAEAATAEEETIHLEPFVVSKELVIESMKQADRIARSFKG